MDDDSPDKCSCLEIQNLDESVLAASIDRFPPHCDRQDGTLVTLEGILQDRGGRRAIPQLPPVNLAPCEEPTTHLDRFIPTSRDKVNAGLRIRIKRVIRPPVWGRGNRHTVYIPMMSR